MSSCLSPRLHRTRLIAGGLLIVALLLSATAGWAADDGAPTPQDLQLAARVIGFQDKPVSGRVRLGIAFDPGNQGSAHDARIVAATLQDGVTVGGIELRSVSLPQAMLAQAGALDAVFAARGVDAALLGPMLARLHVPCLTVDQAQIEHGACMVAVRSVPAVSIVLSQANAAAAGVHFATAFRMMVKEQ